MAHGKYAIKELEALIKFHKYVIKIYFNIMLNRYRAMKKRYEN